MQKKYIVRLTEEERETCRQIYQEAQRHERESSSCSDFVEGRCGSAGVDRSANRRGVLVSNQDRQESPTTLRSGGIRGGAGAKETQDSADGEMARQQAGNKDHRHAAWSASERLCQRDSSIARTQGGRTGDRRFSQPRNRSANAKKNGMTNRNIEYWVIPPEADAEFVVNMEEVLETY